MRLSLRNTQTRIGSYFKNHDIHCHLSLSNCDLAKRDLAFFMCLSTLSDSFEAFIIFSIRHEIRRIDLHKRDYSLLVPGLRNTIALDFHFSHSLLYWTDVVEDKIYRGKLSDTGGKKKVSRFYSALNLKIFWSIFYNITMCFCEGMFKACCDRNVAAFKGTLERTDECC